MGFLGKLLYHMIWGYYSGFMEWATKTTVSGCLITSVSTSQMHFLCNFLLYYQLLQSSLYREVLHSLKGEGQSGVSHFFLIFNINML